MKPFIVAEMSANHLGSLDRALAIVDAAADAGADAIKLQTWDTMVIDKSYIVKDGPWAGRNLAGLYDEAKTPWDWHRYIFERAKNRGIIAFSTPFDGVSVEFLEALHCPMYKVASFEIVDIPLIEKIAKTGKPMVLSTGMAMFDEIELALFSIRKVRPNDGIVLLKCTSAYPAPAAAANLAAMRHMREIFDQPVGLSDHTEGIGVAVAAVTLGAAMIEKHLTLSRADGGPDAAFSLEPTEFKALVTECRRAWEAIQEPDWQAGPSGPERPQLELRRSLYIARDVKAGQVLGAHDVRSARPACGLPPRYLPDVIGKTAKWDAARGTPLTTDMLADWS